MCFAPLYSNYSFAFKFLGKRKLVQIMLIKCWWYWHLGVNFTNILWTAFFYFQFDFIIVWQKNINIGTYAARKMLVKFTIGLYRFRFLQLRNSGTSFLWHPGVDFTNVLLSDFSCTDPASAKRNWWLDCLFCTFGICSSKKCS